MKDQNIDILDILSILKKNLLPIFICTVLIAGIACTYTAYFLQPKYTASVTFYAAPNKDNSQVSALTGINELNFTAKVMNTYMEILKTTDFFEKLSVSLINKYTIEELKKYVTIQQVPDTEIFKVSVTCSEPEAALKIAEQFALLAPDRITAVKDAHSVKIVDPARLPKKADNLNVARNSVIGAFVGFLLSFGVFFMIHLLDNRINTQYDLANVFQSPVLGCVPDINQTINDSYAYVSSNDKKVKTKIRKNDITSSKNEYVIFDDSNTNFSLSESFKHIRTNLTFAVPNKSCKKIIFSSALPNEGKSTISVNVAAAFAQTNSKVLIIDCDLRKPKVNKFFNFVNKNGLSNVLAGMCDTKDVISDTKSPNLKVITSGTIPPNPAELLGSDAMANFIQTVEKDFDCIIFDTPPINIVSDTFGLIKNCDGCVLVVKAGSSTFHPVLDAVNSLEFAHANFLGFILNGVDANYSRDGKYKYSYKYKYANTEQL